MGIGISLMERFFRFCPTIRLHIYFIFIFLRESVVFEFCEVVVFEIVVVDMILVALFEGWDGVGVIFDLVDVFGRLVGGDFECYIRSTLLVHFFVVEDVGVADGVVCDSGDHLFILFRWVVLYLYISKLKL